MSNVSQQPSSPVAPPVGIDLGTTYSVIAYVDAGGRPTTIANDAGEFLTPSAVLVEDDELVVGREAVKASAFQPDSFAECFKRDMGRPAYRRPIRGVQVPPEVLSAFVLGRLKDSAERRLGPIGQVVITVPAFFDETRRKATQDAGRLAGLDVLDIINEPTAAALAFGYQHGFVNLRSSATEEVPTPTRILVYDLGGGTFDVTVLEIEAARFRALATDGDVQLGGKDFDERLVDYMAEQFLAAHGVDPRSDPQDAMQLWLDAQEAKHTLSQRARANVISYHAGVRHQLEITRQQFEDLTRDLLERTETTTSLVVKDAGLNWSGIDRVLLVGGASRMPMVAEMLARVTGKPPDCSASPDEAVAHGAALYAAMLMSRSGGSQLVSCELINVNSHSLGVAGLDTKTGRRVNAIVIPKNTKLPCHAARVFETARADQRGVRVAVVEGESHRPEECISLGECVVRDMPPGLPAGTPVHVEFSYAANGRIAVSARVPQTRQSAHVEMRRDTGHGLEDLESWKARLLGVRPPDVPSAGESGAPVNLKDHGSVLRRLDTLYAAIGKSAVGLALPESLIRCQQAAQKAAAVRGHSHEAVHQQAEARKQAAAGTAEAVRRSSELARARSRAEQAKTQEQFAYLVLGRDCVQAGFQPPWLDAVLREVKELQTHLAEHHRNRRSRTVD